MTKRILMFLADMFALLSALAAATAIALVAGKELDPMLVYFLAAYIVAAIVWHVRYVRKYDE